MKNSTLLFSLLIVVAGSVALRAEQAPDPKTASSDDALNVQLAETYWNLAKVDLDQALDANRRVPGTFPMTSIESLQDEVQSAQSTLDAARGKAAGKSVNPFVPAAEVKLKLAEQDYNSALAANRADAQAVSPFEVERLRLTVELCRIRLAKAKNLDTESPIAQLQWQVELMGEELTRLKKKVSQLSKRN